MNKEGKYKIVLIEPSEIVATGIAAIIDRNPEFAVVKTLSNINYFNATGHDVDIVIVNPAVIDYNDRLDIRRRNADRTRKLGYGTRRVYCVSTMNVSVYTTTMPA